MKKKLNILLSASGHLPSGTAEADFEALYDTEIKPLVQALNKFPRITMTFHYSGVVLYWIERHHPELFMLLEDILSRKQAEFLGGGFYHPMLPLLPLADKIGQIEMLTTYLRKQFGKRPQGCWVPDAAWEQNLVGPLNSCGMSYTFMEDRQFSGAGIKPGAGGLFFPCVTEDQGKLITVFPLARGMGRELRNGTVSPDALFDGISPEEDAVLVLPVEGENPSLSYEALFEKLSGADSRAEFTTPARIFKNLRGLGKVYFPAIRVPPGENGIHSRQFLADCPDAGGIYAKTIHVHTLINNKLRGDKARKRTAMEELWKAQDSGIFSPALNSGSGQIPRVPGFFHAPVRHAAYRSLLEAEKITREKGKFAPSLSFFDFNLDGEDEYIFQDDKLNCCVKPRGAGIFELDYLPATWNYLNTFNSENRERRSAFVDWFAPAETNLDDAGPAGIPGGYFCGSGEYETGEIDRLHRRLVLRLPPRPDCPWGDIEIEKTWQLKKNSLLLEYVLKNSGAGPQSFAFCPSVDLSFPGEGEAFLRVLVQREGGKGILGFGEAHTLRGIKLLEFQDIQNEAVISLESSRSCDLRLFQVRAGAPGFEEYQSTCLMPFLPVSLEAGKNWKATFTLKISS